MKILLTGATGFIGHQLVPSLLSDGHKVTVLARSSEKADEIFGADVKIIVGDPSTPGEWQEEIGCCDAIINLCGAPIMKGKWTPERKKLLRDSRIIPTTLIVEAMEEADRRPQVLLSGSAYGYYGFGGDEPFFEDAGHGTDFLATLAGDWEEAAIKATTLGVRVVRLRTGMVLGRGGGALAQLISPVKFFVGGPIGSGKQFVSWIHIDDHVGITKMAMMDKSITGGLNLTAPNPVTNKEFMKTLGQVMGRPSWLPVPGFALKMAYGEGASLILEGQRVLPKKAQDAGFEFRFANLKDALSDILLAKKAPAS